MPDQVLTAVSVRRVVKLTIQNLSGMGKNVLISANRRASLAFVFPARAQAVLRSGMVIVASVVPKVEKATIGTEKSASRSVQPRFQTLSV